MVWMNGGFLLTFLIAFIAFCVTISSLSDDRVRKSVWIAYYQCPDVDSKKKPFHSDSDDDLSELEGDEE